MKLVANGKEDIKSKIGDGILRTFQGLLSVDAYGKIIFSKKLSWQLISTIIR